MMRQLTHLTDELRAIRDDILAKARGVGLDPFETVFEMVDVEELNEIAAYGGFPVRYPHWRFGMDFEQLRTTHTYGLSRIYELVINNDPCYAYLLRSNSLVLQKLVIAHVFGHSDFFRHNMWFARTNRKMVDEMANHGTRVRRHIDRQGLERVEDFLDACLSLENLIDAHVPFAPDPADRDATDLENRERVTVTKLPSKGYMDRFVNPPEFLEQQRRKAEAERAAGSRRFPSEPRQDVLGFLLQHAPLERWQRDVLEIVRDEAYYFAPQRQTKVMNEGWACVRADTLVFTDAGLVPMEDVVAGWVDGVSDGEQRRRVTAMNVIQDHPTVKLTTRRGLVLDGSNNHRVLRGDGSSWARLDELQPGDSVCVSGGAGVWPASPVPLEWYPAERYTLSDVAVAAGVSLSTVIRHRNGRPTRAANRIARAMAGYSGGRAGVALPRRRKPLDIPAQVDASLGAFLGYLVGDGHVSRAKRQLGLTTGDGEQADRFEALVSELFGLECRRRLDGTRERVTVYSEALTDFLVRCCSITTGPSARRKAVPDVVRRSPEPVVRAFLRAYFDCDGYAGTQGVILSTASDAMSQQVQLLLLNYGILSRRRLQGDGCWHVHVTGASARVFAECVGFGLERKQRALDGYVASHRWFKTESWTDEVVSVETGRADVYDITVEESHRYAAAGFINHNSYFHSKLLTQHDVLTDAEVVDFADHHAATTAMQPGQLNPYKLGIELWRDIEDRWNKGRFGPEWERCDDLDAKQNWDLKLGLGTEKIFEVRKIFNDVGFIDTFLTEEFCHEHKLFVYDWNPRTGRYEIAGRDFAAVKRQLLFGLTNLGSPHITVTDGNFGNRGELFLVHRHEGVDLRFDHARATLENLHRIWQRPVHLQTQIDTAGKVFSFDGTDHTETDTTDA